MKALQLKNAILQLAIQGKLVPQDPNDEPASVLLEKIQAEKAKLIAEGKIKKSRTTSDKLPSPTESDFPFDIPESWVWCKLGDICLKITDGTHHSPVNTETGDFLYITAKNIKNGTLDFSNISYVSTEIHNEIYNRCNPEKGDILYIKDGATTGTGIINPLDIPFSMLSSVALLKTPNNIDNKYLNYVMNSHYFYNISIGSMSGTGIPRITLTKLEAYIIPLPPLNEQKRIVEKLEEILPFIEEYDKKEQKLTALHQQFPEQLKKSILQSAIQGKLVEQDPNDEPAGELIKRIQAEKVRLILEKKIKKPKIKSEIILRDNLPYEIVNGVERCIADEAPFEIPENWMWVRLGDIGDWGAGATPNRHEPQFYNNGTIPWLKTGDLNDGYITSIPEYITDLALERNSLKINPIGSVLIAMYGATIGKLGILNIEAATNQACCACQVFNDVYNKYLFYYLMSQKKSFQRKSEGSGQPNISREKIINYLFPFPPLNEQKRIVQKIEELFSYIEYL